ncbi:MAG TPA: 3-oxoacyl-ACP synthase [Candidatus Omnitrophica bacterium]|nr:MAG: 3-oxoacyl-ACP synthase [Omnitrophica WOR_2 bacterium GWA2_63_20]OGX17820.1 MAG: 3-oxoacyl-ACP synthase [Omnitrophica WOR_2 bacterium GWF2_63_9]OGX31651.1 MAG: 3-oxoacyl-ACP synthase [Omnitrophica WOR_2 bacterium RIFCSPHIGHO2_12_FULL_64_13]OGX35817.1 MAG: 3-oxoacyl-ACP synthase [Omnitrophica WOR_2 bacterium RIFCSPHIGHO2_02_FULL_63_39]OGX44930.1 MAG: 3-oxoacyl-ACP synthase [Omnitrophica WOR_2 bacterium RIFCSPLOWO2_02_FULL_63_16]OGX49339.1 MAG: 3-oxoacyl-ACP synthase [Omnitrophica WOR_2 b
MTPPGSKDRIGIVGLGMNVPKKILTNFDLEKMVETSDAWIIERTGIRERRICEPGTGTSDLAYPAAVDALKQAGLKPQDVDLIIVGTTSPDMIFPSTACVLQHRLGATAAACFDLAAACSGSVFAMITAQQYLQTGRYKHALVVGAEIISNFVDWTDRSTCVLFGDGAGACVMTKVDRGGMLATDMGADGSAAELLYIPGGGSKAPSSHASVDQRLHYLRMNGTEVFKLAVRRMAESAKTVLAQAGFGLKDLDCLIPHQANTRIIQAMAKLAGIPMEKVFVNVERYGNTSAASNLMALYEAAQSGAIKRGDRVVLVAFGAGLTWGSILLEW